MRQDVEFTSEGITLRGWLFTPDTGSGPYPTVVAAHGFGAVKEMYVDRFAEAFAEAGVACLLYDHRNFGASDGEPRQEADPWAQVRDYREAITFASTLPEVDADRIGAFGSSYSGGHVIAVAAFDKRVKAVYSQVPLVSGGVSSSRFVRSDAVAATREAFHADRLARFRGEAPAVVPMISDDPNGVAALPDLETWEWYQGIPDELLATWRNEVTLRSVELFWEYEPGALVRRISPTPFLLVVLADDILAHADQALEMYERALEPKRLVVLPGGHFAVYGDQFETVKGLATDFFVAQLAQRSEVPA
jgi:uncharacterized protein